MVRTREDKVEVPVRCRTHRGSKGPDIVLWFLWVFSCDHSIHYLHHPHVIINTEGFYRYMQITMIDTPANSISLADKQLISSWVEISIKQQGNISTVPWQMQTQNYHDEKGKASSSFPNTCSLRGPVSQANSRQSGHLDSHGCGWLSAKDWKCRGEDTKDQASWGSMSVVCMLFVWSRCIHPV